MYTITNMYTDDIFGASNNDEEVRKRKDEIGNVWDMKDVGETEYFLGMQFSKTFNQRLYNLPNAPTGNIC